MAGSGFESEDNDPQGSTTSVTQDENPNDGEETVEDEQWNGIKAAMEELSFIAFGDVAGPDKEDGMDVARIHWSKSMVTDSKIRTLNL